MANTFANYTNTAVTTSTTVYTGPVATQSTVIGMTIANTTTNSILTSVTLNGVFLVKNAPIPVGGAFVPVGGDQKLVVTAGDLLNVEADFAVDVITSVLEIS